MLRRVKQRSEAGQSVEEAEGVAVVREMQTMEIDGSNIKHFCTLMPPG